MIDVKRERPDLSFWGGFVGGRKWKEKFSDHADAKWLETCWLDKKKIRFFDYYAGLCQSKVALAPSGYAPWTYRHFEAIYARCMVVSNDLSPYDFLIPFPRDAMEEVREGESVVCAIERALDRLERTPDIVEKNLIYMNRWLDAGTYSKHRPETLERFMRELGAYTRV